MWLVRTQRQLSRSLACDELVSKSLLDFLPELTKDTAGLLRLNGELASVPPGESVVFCLFAGGVSAGDEPETDVFWGVVLREKALGF